MVKPDTGSGKLSWAVAGTTTWKAMGIVDEVPFIVPERKIDEHNGIGSSVAYQRFIRQEPQDITLSMKINTWAFVAYCLQSDPAPASSVRTFVYKAQNVGALIDVAYDDATIRYTAESCAVRKVVIKADAAGIPRMEVTLSVPKVTIAAPGGTMVAFDTTNEISILNCALTIGGTAVQSPKFELTIEPNLEHGNVIGTDYDESVNFGNVKITLDIEGYYDSTLYDHEDYAAQPTATYVATVGDTTSTHYLQCTMVNPFERATEFICTGDQAVKMSKTLQAATAPTITCKDPVFTTNRYWT